jgi:predicted dehydrogenase
MDEKVRAALIGCGGFSQTHTQAAIERTGRFQIVSCHDPDREAAEASARRWGARACASFEDALAADGVEAALLLTPNHLHRPQAEAALAAGKHVFVEKPMANTVADAMAMVRAAEAAGKILAVGHQTRRGRAFRLAAEAVRSGRLGRIVGAEAHFSHGGGKTLRPGAWRGDPARCPGLPLNVIGVHLADILNLLLGRPREVFAMHRRALVPANNDCTTTLIAYEDPVVATLVSHYCTPQVHWLRVSGTDAVLEVLEGGTHFVLFRDKFEIQREMITHGANLEEEFDELARAIREGGPVETDGRAALWVVAIVEASVRSAREGRIVRIDELVRDF